MATISADIQQPEANGESRIPQALLQAVGVMVALYALQLFMRLPNVGMPQSVFLPKLFELIGLAFAVHVSNRIPPRGRVVFVVAVLALYWVCQFFVYLAWMYVGGVLCDALDCYSSL